MNILKLSASRKSSLVAYLVMIPILLYHFWIIVLPSFTTIYASFTEWNGIGAKTFIGFENYVNLFQDPDFFTALGNNLKWMLIFLTVPIMLGFLLGYVLSRLKKGQIVYRTIYFLPYVISAAVAGKIFATFFNPYFGINLIFERLAAAFGQTFHGIDWLAPANALFSVAFVDNWHWWGFVLVIIMSGLQQIDPALYEVADVEGCNTLQKMWYITLPGLKATLIFIITTTMVWSLGTFEYVWVMTKGGPGTELLSTMMYKNSILKYNAGYASSIATIQAVLSFAILGAFALIRKKSEE